MTEPHLLEDFKRGIGLTSISGYGTNNFTARNVSLEQLVSIAFNKDSAQITAKPNWLDSRYYDLIAEPDGDQPLTADEMKPLLRHLLESRFYLKTHTVTVQIQGYDLDINRRIDP